MEPISGPKYDSSQAPQAKFKEVFVRFEGRHYSVSTQGNLSAKKLKELALYVISNKLYKEEEDTICDLQTKKPNNLKSAAQNIILNIKDITNRKDTTRIRDQAVSNPVRFAPIATVHVVDVHSNQSEPILIPTNLFPRTDSGKMQIKFGNDSMEVGKGYFERGEGVPSVKRSVERHYANKNEPQPDSSKEGPNVTFHKLINEKDVDYQQLTYATANKLKKIIMNDSVMSLFGVAKENELIVTTGANLIASELDILIQEFLPKELPDKELPNKKIKNQYELKSALIERVKANNKRNFTEGQLETFTKAINTFFKDREVQTVLEQFCHLDIRSRLSSWLNPDMWGL